MSATLQPCPFCGCADLEQDNSQIFGGHYIECQNCGVIVLPQTEDARETADQWNKRASGWQPIETAPRDGTEILTVGADSNNTIATKWFSPGPFARIPPSYYPKPSGWYWSSWSGEPVGPCQPTH